MDIIGWANNVNKTIIDQTSITIGDGSFQENKNEAGFDERQLTSLVPADTFNVVMDFDWYTEDENGLTEFDRFKAWYKFQHLRGVVPFIFPSITKENIMGKTKECYYKITSGLQATKSGFCQRVTMTWKEVFTGVISIPDEPAKIIAIEPYKDYIIFIYDGILSTEPLAEKTNLQISTDGKTWKKVSLKNVRKYGDREWRMSFEELSEGNYIFRINGISNTLVV